MNMRKIIAIFCIVGGMVCVAVPFLYQQKGQQETNLLLEEFEEQINTGILEDEGNEKTEKTQESGETTTCQEKDALLEQGAVIGIIEIEALNIRCPIVEGAGSEQIRYAIGHMTKTTGIGEEGNCVLAGHTGSRHGRFFTDLIYIDLGEIVQLTDKTGTIHLYEVAETSIVGPYDNSVIRQTDDEILTLLTCAESGTMRFICRCIPIQNEN